MARLTIKITSGVDDLERCNQGWTVASTAVAAGVAVSLWLTGDAVWFATPGYAGTVVLDGAQDFATAVDLLLQEGTLTVCTQCLGRRDLTPQDLIPGVRVGGAAGFVEEVLDPDTKALVY